MYARDIVIRTQSYKISLLFQRRPLNDRPLVTNLFKQRHCQEITKLTQDTSQLISNFLRKTRNLQ